MMLHTKYHGSRPCGFRHEGFFQVFPICDRGKIGLIALHSNFMNLGLLMLNTVSSS